MLLIAGASTSVGYQDLTGLFAHRPGVTERARMFVVNTSFTTLKTATFAWPTPSEGPLGAAIPRPPLVPVAASVNRAAKADRLPLAVASRLVDPSPGTNVTGPASLASAGGAAGIGTDPSEASDTEVAALDAGDPTGDPSEYDDLDEADGVQVAAIGNEVGAMIPGDVVDIGGEPDADLSETGKPETPDASTSAGVSSEPSGPVAPSESAASSESAAPFEAATPSQAANSSVSPARTASAAPRAATPPRPIYRVAAFIFDADPAALPPQPFHYLDGGSSVAAKGEVTGEEATPSSPAQRLGLEGKRLARAEKCLAEAVYFESRGEPERGQVAVAQVVMNRVFSGYYPADVCRTVYQNAHRKLACQFTFACDNVRDVVTEPELWKQAERIAADMLFGRVWDDKVGKATHYHAMSVHPRWVREMRKLDRIGQHTFYRPRRWDS